METAAGIKSRIRRILFAALTDIFPAVFAVIIIALFRIDAAYTEAIFSQTIFPAVSWIIGIIPRLLPFSLISVLAIMSPAILLLVLIYLAVGLIKQNTAVPIRVIRWSVRTASVVFLIFAVNCAPNYARITFAEQCGLTIRPATSLELAEMCADLIVRTREARELISENEDGIFEISDTFSESAKTSKSAFHALTEKYPFLLKVYDEPKPMAASELLSYLEVTGFYSCHTNEATVNVHMPDLELPFTMCHELAHTSGFMREDEANFIGYLACSQSDDPSFRYSGLITALNYSMWQLYSANEELYWYLRDYYSDGMNRDLALHSEYWGKYKETKSAEIYTAVNDAYLKANQQTDGHKSYGRMVDLLLAEYRLKNGLQ